MNLIKKLTFQAIRIRSAAQPVSPVCLYNLDSKWGEPVRIKSSFGNAPVNAKCTGQ